MATWAHIVDAAVVDVIPLPDGVIPGRDVLPPDQAFVACGADVRSGWSYADGLFAAPPPPPAPPAPVTIVRKSDLYRRCTEEEAGMVDAAVAAASSRMRGLFQAVSEFQSDAEEYGLLKQAAVELFGADRAAELLVPSA